MIDVGSGRGWRVIGPSRSLPSYYPIPKIREIVPKSWCGRSVRDRGVGGSNPLAPTNFPWSIPVNG